MCFSAAASFTASVALGGVGMATLSNVKRKKDLPFAVIPLIFALQQALEGFVWLNIPGGTGSYAGFFSYFFLFFALFWWPWFAPWSASLQEKSREIRFVQKVLAGFGGGAGLLLFLVALAYQVPAVVTNRCISYSVNIPYGSAFIILYVAATAGALIISKNQFVHWLGILLLMSGAITHFVAESVAISVWCFFAALMSGLIYFHFRYGNVPEKVRRLTSKILSA